MWELFKQFTDVLNPFGIVIGVATAIPVFWTWWEVVFGERRRRRVLLRQARNHVGMRPAILVVDFLPEKDMQAAVAHTRQNIPELQAIPEDRVVRIAVDHWLKPGDMEEIYRRVQKGAGEVLALGADVVHLFYGGPSIGAALIGTELANSARVLFYQHHQGQYQNFGPLREPRMG